MAFKFLKDIMASATDLIRSQDFRADTGDVVESKLPTAMMNFVGDFGKPTRRTHHEWLHPTKGWRGEHSAHGGTNRRRKLTDEGRKLLDAH